MSNLLLGENKLPLVLPTSVARVTADGRPTKHLIDWEQLTRNWYFKNAVALDKKLTEVSSVIDDPETGLSALASITEDLSTAVGLEGAVATKITGLEAKYNNISANGEIFFAAKAAPSGATAAYGVYLTAGDAFAGMEILADSGGGASIGFAANSFKLTDSGTAQNVFDYSSGVFTFNVPVRIRTGDILDGAISSFWNTVEASSHTAFVDATLRAGSRVAIIATTKGSNGNQVSPFSLSDGLEISVEGSVIATTGLNYFRDINGANTQYFLLSTTLQARYNVPADGVYRLRVRAGHELPYGAAILAIEITR